MDRSAPNPIPNSSREGEKEGWEEEKENSQRKRRGKLEISRLTIKTCLQAVKEGCGEHITSSLSSSSLQSSSDSVSTKVGPENPKYLNRVTVLKEPSPLVNEKSSFSWFIPTCDQSQMLPAP